MKNLSTKIAFTFVILTIAALLVYAYPGGITGRTLKTTTSGCSCHGPTFTADVTVTIAGPDTVFLGQTRQYSLTVSKLSKTGAGLDIATRTGTLAPVSSNIHLSSGELTHNNNIPMTNGSVTVLFNYTAPGSPTIDTIWATGLATNSNGGTGGDDWNWAPSKRVVVRNPLGIQNQSTAHKFKLYQNYPNPFNPETHITFELYKKSFVKLVISDVMGNEVEVPVESVMSQGAHTINWDASAYASGIYFYRLVTDNFTETKRMILLK